MPIEFNIKLSLILLLAIQLLCPRLLLAENQPFYATGNWSSQTETYLPEDLDSLLIKAEHYEDSSGELALEDVLSLPNAQWQVIIEDYANFGYTPSTIWYRFDISNHSNKVVDQTIQISYPLLDTIDYYRFASSGELTEHRELGDLKPYSQREVQHPHFLFPIQLKPEEKNTIYLRVETGGSHLVPLTLWNNIPLYTSLLQEDEYHAVYFGIVLVIVFMNSLIFIALREKTFLYYAISTFLFMLFFAALRGKLYPYVFSSWPGFHHYLFLFLPSLCFISSALFTREFLRVKDYNKYLNYLIDVVVLIQCFCLVGVFVLDRQTSLQYSVMTALPSSFILLMLGPIMSFLGNRTAWVYTLAWGTFMSGITISALSKQGFIPSSFVTEYGLQIGSAVEIFILTAALVYRFYIEHNSRVAAQEKSLRESEEKFAVELKLLESSMMHPITLKPNRICFEQTITNTISKSNEHYLVVTIENKRFVEITKTLGQQNADTMLCDLAKRYDEQLEDDPAVVTIHGPSFEAKVCSLERGVFALLINDKGLRKSMAQQNPDKPFEDLLKAWAKELLKPIAYKDMVLDLQPVVGVACYPEHGLNASTLLRHSEIAVDFAVANQNSISYYCPEQDQLNARRLTIISELKSAIGRDALSLYFQPKFDLDKRDIIGVEALVRWQHIKYGMVRPDEFIPMAEQTGVIKKLTRWVFENALSNYQLLRNAGYDLTMSINVSAVNLKENDLVSYLQSTMEAYEIDPGRLYIELTETSMMGEPKSALATLRQMQDIGLNISIDDFGSGYSSLSYLKELPANEIKLDKSLVSGLAESTKSNAVVKTAITMCHELGFTVVAEGVETDEVMMGLRRLDCDLVQGYLLTPPLPMERLLEWLEHPPISEIG